MKEIKNEKVRYRNNVKDRSLPVIPKGPNLLLVKLPKLMSTYWKEEQGLAKQLVTFP